MPVLLRLSCLPRLIAVVLVITAMAGCSQFQPRPFTDARLQQGALTQTQGQITIRSRVFSDSESREWFGTGLAEHGIQAVWFGIDNRSPSTYMFMDYSVDREYFSPGEVTWLTQPLISQGFEQERRAFFRSQALSPYILPFTTTKGFVFTRTSLGGKDYQATLVGERQLLEFNFATLASDFPPLQRLQREARLARGEDLTLEQLRTTITSLPATTRGKNGQGAGDPVNVVFIGDSHDIVAALLRQGWDVAEDISGRSALKTARSFGLGTRYRFSPVSNLYYFGRPQDMAVQKARDSIHQRNHMRLWAAPFTVEGQTVVIGQISRDIGVRFTTRTANLTTHKIDPDIDEARDYLLQDLLYSQTLTGAGYLLPPRNNLVGNSGENLTGDSWTTDGAFLVLFVKAYPVNIKNTEFFYWSEHLPGGGNADQ